MKKLFLNWCKPLTIMASAVLLSMFYTGCSDKPGNLVKVKEGFLNPPQTAKPRVWWHWMNGNITKEGIRADLEWMHRVGIGGFQNFDAALLTPQIVEKRLVYMTTEWKEAFRFTTILADSLGLEMAIAGSPGWSESGGPWVKPEQAMKKFVWSETRIEGGKPFTWKLPAPPSTTGPFQNLALREGMSLTGIQQAEPGEYYADAAVVAYRIPDNDLSLSALNPVITSSGGRFNLAFLTDGDLASSVQLPYTKPGENAWIMYDFGKPVKIHSLTIVGGGFVGQFGFGSDQNPRALEAGDDGIHFKKVIDIPIRGVAQKTLSFSPVTARYFRFTWKTPQPGPVFDLAAALGLESRPASKGPTGTDIAELILHSVARIDHFEEKAAFATASDLYSYPTPEIDPEDAVKKSEIIDLTSLMKADGTLEWTPPAGNWIIIRLGYSLTGHKNSPASAEATGLEVDKLNAAHVKAYFTNYLDQYKDATGGLMGRRGLQYIITDSWEAGTQNWTDSMISEFSKRRGYDMLPWVPVLTGHVVESSAASERFLWDFRKTLSELVADNHYDLLTELLKGYGMGRYTESHEGGRAFIGDGMDVKRKADIPMSATWTPGSFGSGTEVSTGYKADVRESASVSHLYGQNLVAAESMTAIRSAWAWSPELLKPTADMEMACGLNRFVIHTSVHQPVNDKIPGLGLGPFGQWFTRHETWAEQAKPWIDYLARSSWMLQQGEFVADILYYYGEDNNITSLFGSKLPEIPEGYNYDFASTDALVSLLDAANGMITTESGMKYRVLALDHNSVYMPLQVLRKINELVNKGAIVTGPKPVASPSNSDDVKEFRTLAGILWPSTDGVRSVGKGKVFSGLPIDEVLKSLDVKPDFEYPKNDGETRLLYVHRRMPGAEIYWVNSRNDKFLEVEAKFRVAGKVPEIWDPVTGGITPVSFKIENGITSVPLKLAPADALFVVFSGRAAKNEVRLPAEEDSLLTVITGPWDITFQADRGAPPITLFDTLIAWNENENPGIKYFSGTAAYTRKFQVPQGWLKEGSRIYLDLGSVKNIAEVLVNGKPAGIAWKVPFRFEISGALNEGENMLEVMVTNLWVNRLIGDAQPGVKEKITYTTMPFYRNDSRLLPSGLLGPVRIILVAGRKN
jgi:hypothetical protein